MPNETRDTNARMDPTQPMPAEAQEFARKLHGMLDGQEKDEATVARQLAGLENMFDLIAAGLYSLASMLVGEGEDSIGLVETAVATAEVSSCSEPEEARRASRRALVTAALDLLAKRDPQRLAAPEGLEHADTCIEDDDLDAAGVSREELESMMAGPDRDRVRAWLESLPTAMRTIFVLRAVAGYSTAETAGLLRGRDQGPGIRDQKDRDQGLGIRDEKDRDQGPGIRDQKDRDQGPGIRDQKDRDQGPGIRDQRAVRWSAEAVRELYRQGLCSLASQMIKSGTRD
jgi:DNA-directed RNA polymerase specialized sigma24 family protein